ncbi:Putative bifunctional phosphatase/peptidyl-prolyl cis-trans isomerase [Paenibacillus konkukensis]|uniref:Bifunctional phosphatase/peptidyl-prolyl cis-trans isomerase n=1 Tax=Paenibacillus konkukensis TaxID=2020716 RepID=A0ABY4RML4_9BACL|nr:Cof-type HAD-IIB family hydrolase [Paenibacillus konkukensis]UQZ83270.1 Putative bifunctional phosphatase/peptidyl-prolyl cis-trans isomerase [Paenibacillus konkukensis]
MTQRRSMIFFDIDGTLLDRRKCLPPSAKEAVLALKQAGHEVAFATGRSPFMMEELRKELGIDSFVGFNGQYVMLKDAVIYRNPIPTERLRELTECARSAGHPLVYLDHEGMKSSVPRHAYIEAGIGSLQYEHPDHDPDYYIGRDIYQTMLFCAEEDEAGYVGRLSGLDFIRWHPFSMDVLPSGGSKAQGIERLIGRLGFARENVYAFGDHFNDVEMLRYVGHGIAMGNAPASVKQAARYITRDVGQDGIAYGLELVGLL